MARTPEVVRDCHAETYRKGNLDLSRRTLGALCQLDRSYLTFEFSIIGNATIFHAIALQYFV